MKLLMLSFFLCITSIMLFSENTWAKKTNLSTEESVALTLEKLQKDFSQQFGNINELQDLTKGDDKSKEKLKKIREFFKKYHLTPQELKNVQKIFKYHFLMAKELMLPRTNPAKLDRYWTEIKNKNKLGLEAKDEDLKKLLPTYHGLLKLIPRKKALRHFALMEVRQMRNEVLKVNINSEGYSAVEKKAVAKLVNELNSLEDRVKNAKNKKEIRQELSSFHNSFILFQKKFWQKVPAVIAKIVIAVIVLCAIIVAVIIGAIALGIGSIVALLTGTVGRLEGTSVSLLSIIAIVVFGGAALLSVGAAVAGPVLVIVFFAAILPIILGV